MEHHINVTASASSLSSVIYWPSEWWVVHNTLSPSYLQPQYSNEVELDLPLKKVLFPYERTTIRTIRTHFKNVERDPKGKWPGKMTEIAKSFVSSRKFLTWDQAFFFCFFFREKGKTKRKDGPVDRRLANFPSLFQILVHV